MGLFVVKPKAQNLNDHQKKENGKISVIEKDLKIVLFLCTTEKDRHHLHQSGFSVVGDYLCWSYPEEKFVHVLNMTEIKAAEIDRDRTFLGSVSELGSRAGNYLKRAGTETLDKIKLRIDTGEGDREDSQPSTPITTPNNPTRSRKIKSTKVEPS